MPKIIVVQGVSDTGKSTAIRLAMNHLGLFIRSGGKEDRRDVLVVATARASLIGFASGGDSATVIKKSIDFFSEFSPLPPYMVFACHKRGLTIPPLEKFADGLGEDIILIPADRVPLSNVLSANRVLRDRILAHLPRLS